MTPPTATEPCIFGMDTYFFRDAWAYPLSIRCAMLREIGYTGAYLTLGDERSWAELPAFQNVAADHGLRKVAVYLNLPLLPADRPQALATWKRLLGNVREGSVIELSLSRVIPETDPSTKEGHALAVEWLEQILPDAEARDLTISLYPHFIFTMERHDDALALCEQFKHPRLRMNFCGFHWYVVHSGRDLRSVLTRAAPYLQIVNLCGVSKGGDVGGHRIQPFGEGQMDNFAVLALLKEIGYTGPVGFQGYSIGGDPYANLERSLRAYQAAAHRLATHPEWTGLAWSENT